MYYYLIRKTVEKLYESVETERKEMLMTIATSFYMSKAGYETRLTNAILKALFLYVYSAEHIVGIPYIDVDGKKIL